MILKYGYGWICKTIQNFNKKRYKVGVLWTWNPAGLVDKGMYKRNCLQ
jgi:hypothetical protein